MARLAVSIMLLALVLELSLVSRALARIIHDDSPLPRLVATVIAESAKTWGERRPKRAIQTTR